MEAVFQEVVREERAAGRTILLSSHILAEVEALCDRVSIIRDGPHGLSPARSPSCGGARSPP